MKKLLSLGLALCLVMVMGSVAFAADQVDIGYSLTDTTNPFIGWLGTAVPELVEKEGLNIMVADAGGSATTQMEQVENFIAMNVKVIAVMPIDPEGMVDVIRKAHEAGIKTMIAGADSGADEGIYDCVMNTDQYIWGQTCADMALEWIEEQGIENAKVIVVKFTESPESAKRSQGIEDRLTESGKVQVVVAPSETQSAADAKTIIENMWLQNSDTSVICTYNADAAVGINEYLMGLNSVDRSKLAIFSCDTSDEVQEMINASKNDESVFRGTTSIAGPAFGGESYPLPDGTAKLMKELVDGTYNYGMRITDAIAKVYPAE